MNNKFDKISEDCPWKDGPTCLAQLDLTPVPRRRKCKETDCAFWYWLYTFSCNNITLEREESNDGPYQSRLNPYCDHLNAYQTTGGWYCPNCGGTN